MIQTKLEWDTELQFLEKEMEEVAGEWNGKESGKQEDRAHIAADIIEKCQELRNLLDEFDNV